MRYCRHSLLQLTVLLELLGPLLAGQEEIPLRRELDIGHIVALHVKTLADLSQKLGPKLGHLDVLL